MNIQLSATVTLGLAAVLVWVGIKMLLLGLYKIRIGISLSVEALLIAAPVAASWLKTRQPLALR